MIIDSMLDTDLYKLTMCQLVWKLFHNAKDKIPEVEYKFIHRDGSIFNLANFVDINDVRKEINHLLKLFIYYMIFKTSYFACFKYIIEILI